LDQKVVSTEEGQKLASEFQVPFFETSALSGLNISECFNTIAKQIHEKLLIQQQDNDNNNNNNNKNIIGQKLNPNKPKEQSGGCCGK
jgi:Ras-related protein Rab-8A